LRIAVVERGAKAVADALGVSTSLVYKWCEGEAAHPLDRVEEVIRATGSHLPLAHLCAQAGGAFVKRPEPSQVDSARLVDETQRMLKEFSDVLQALTSAFLNGHITSAEAGTMRQEWEQLLPIVEGLVQACEMRALKDADRPSSPKRSRRKP
jgi:hypothetical protein